MSQLDNIINAAVEEEAREIAKLLYPDQPDKWKRLFQPIRAIIHRGMALQIRASLENMGG